jgi:hypothetical protein
MGQPELYGGGSLGRRRVEKRAGQAVGRAGGFLIQQQMVELARQGLAHQSLEFGVQTLMQAGRESALDVVEELVHMLCQLLGRYASPFAGGVAFGEHPFQPPSAGAPLPRVLGRLADDAEQFHFPIGLALLEFLGELGVAFSGIADRAFGAADRARGKSHAEALAHQAHDFALHGFAEARGSADDLHGVDPGRLSISEDRHCAHVRTILVISYQWTNVNVNYCASLTFTDRSLERPVGLRHPASQFDHYDSQQTTLSRCPGAENARRCAPPCIL